MVILEKNAKAVFDVVFAFDSDPESLYQAHCAIHTPYTFSTDSFQDMLHIAYGFRPLHVKNYVRV